MPDPRARIVLYIDPETFEQEHPDAEKLTPEILGEIAQQVNDDASFIYGYEAWDYAMPGQPFNAQARAAT